MEENQLKKYQKKLESLRSENMEINKSIKEGLRIPLTDSIGELSSYDNHPGDVGDTTFEREKDLGLKLLTEEQLAMIDEALEAVKNGTYGICHVCGREISPERLEIIPYAALCQDCKKKNEETISLYRPVEEKVIFPPFGRVSRENNAFDGEDSWQAVARYGTSESPSDIGSVGDYNDIYIDADEAVGTVEKYESIAAHKEKDGQLYESVKGEDDEGSPFNYANE